MHLITALVMGSVVGWVAGMVMRSSGGVTWNMLIGCVGAMVGRMIFLTLSNGAHLAANPFNPLAWLVAFLGAVILLGAYNMATADAVR